MCYREIRTLMIFELKNTLYKAEKSEKNNLASQTTGRNANSAGRLSLVVGHLSLIRAKWSVFTSGPGLNNSENLSTF